MKKLLILLTSLPVSATAAADAGADREAVIQVVVDFFDAMTDRDVARMQSLMTADGMIYGYREGEDGTAVIRLSHQEYLENLANGDGEIVERFWNPDVNLYGRLATVWTPYDFHENGEFSHCGVNNFSMLHTDAGWVITGVVFSIESDCGASPLGPFIE
jgi:hypothetical protein